MFLVCSTDIDSIVAYTSLIMTNAVVVLLDVGITDQQLTALASRYEPDYMFLPRVRVLSENFWLNTDIDDRRIDNRQTNREFREVPSQ